MKEFDKPLVVKRHIPGFTSTDSSEETTFTVGSLEELKELSFVKNFTCSKDFHQLSVSRGWGGRSLMAELNGGESFYVIAHLPDDEELDLKDWVRVIPKEGA